jgi:phospholipid-transporting ATPase
MIQGLSKKIVIEGDKQLMYRGAKLKNTKWIVGLVVYTGRVTKIMLNSESSADKMSQIEVKVNKLLVGIFLFQIVLCLGCALAYGLTQGQLASHWYLNTDDNLPLTSFIVFLSYLVLFNTMIPISLIVSLEIVKTIQGVFIQKDQLLYNEKRKKGVTVFSSTLNEELGQI